MFQVVIRYMVLIPCLAVNGAFHKGLLGHIQFSQTVDYDMHMNVAAAIVPVHVRTDQCLMSRKVGFCVFQSKLLSPFSRQTTLVFISRIKTDNIVVRFDFILIFVLLVFTVQLLAGRIKGIGFTIQTVQIKLIPHDTISVLVKDQSFPKPVMLENQVLQRSTIVGTLTCDML